MCGSAETPPPHCMGSFGSPNNRLGVVCLEMQASWRWLRIGFWACTAIAIAVVLRRTVALAHPSPVRHGLNAFYFVSGRWGCYCLRDEPSFRWRLGGTLCGSVL